MITHTSINYKSYSLEEREKYLASIDKTIQRKSIIVATCNRVEIYKGDGQVDEATVRHLFELIAGLKSRLIGETSIQGQIRQAYLNASLTNTFDKNLHKLFQTAINVGKKVRNLTGISQGAMSHAQATIQILESKLSSLQGLTIALFGINNLNTNILQYLQRKGATNIFVGNRNMEKAMEIAGKFNIDAFHLSHKQFVIRDCDVVITATSAPHTIIGLKDIGERSKPLSVFDLAVPRDVEPAVGNLQNVELFNVEQIESQIEENLAHRFDKLEEAKNLVNLEVEKFLEAQKKRLDYEIKKTKNTFAA